MADYFSEMGWEPVPDNHTESHQLMLMVRFLQQHGGFADEFNADRLPPPVAKHVIENLAERRCGDGGEGSRRKGGDDEKCAICLKPDEQDELFKVLPCGHEFHAACILPWLARTNSCPMCRAEMPTDDEDYEAAKRFKARERQREQDIDTLHNSMFG